MQVLSVRCGMTKNLGNYESAKLEVEAAPSDGQTADQLLTEVNEYLSKQLNGVPVNEKPAKKEKAKADPTTAASQAAPATSVEKTSDTSTTETPKQKGRGKGSKKAQQQAAIAGTTERPDPKKELQYALDSETLPELLERFNNVSEMRDVFAEQWEAAVTQIADRYRKLNSLDAEPEVLDQLVKAFKRERQKIEAAKVAA